MRKFVIAVLILLSAAGRLSAVESQEAQLFGADDLHINGKAVTSYQVSSGEHILAFTEGFELFVGDNHLKSSQAIVWLNSQTTEYQGVTNVEYKIKVYLQGKVLVDKGAGSKTSGLELSKNIVSGAESMVAEFAVSGEVFVTAENRIVQDVRTTELYHDALVATGQIQLAPAEEPAAAQEAEEPAAAQKGKKATAARKTGKSAVAQTAPAGRKAKSPGVLANVFGKGQPKKPQPETVPQAPTPKIQYPVNISGLGTEPVRITNESIPDGTNIATILNRFYLWQKQDEQGGLLEFQADSAVIFYSRTSTGGPNSVDGLLAGNTVKAIYLRGNIIMTEGQRTIRADEAYYDFQTRQGLVVNAVVRNYDPQRGIPIYLKAEKLRQVAQDKFYARNVTLTSSEFYVPRISATASEIFITDTTAVDEQTGKVDKHSYDATMKNVKMKLDNRTVFWWPQLRSNLERPDIPIRRAQFSRDKTFGTAIETEWYLARILGLREPKGVDSRLMIDSYSKRGTGVGADIEYQRETYFGNINGYVINDKGEDDLGRARQNIDSNKGLRGMINFWHRQFLPEHWQLTLETSYISDETFLESFRREQYFSGRGQETSMHLKWLKDNQAFALLAKWRINNFADELEEIPSAQYHRTGQSLFNDKFTLYSDSSLGRLRQRVGENHSLSVSQEYFTFGTTRNELDFPLKFSRGNIVPYIAGTYGYDDRYGFDRSSAIGAGTGSQAGEKNVFIGELGTRASTQFWKVYNVRSKFWDVNGIRHIVKPYVNAAVFAESTDVVEQKDVFSLGVLQRWQTKRGVGEKSRILDWMRLNLEYTKVSNKNSQIHRPDKTIWNNPFVPLSATLAPDIFNGDLAGYRTFDLFGPQTDSFNADYIWRISDTTAILSDLNYDTTNNKLEQFNIGYSHLCWPNLSYYIGARYLRDIEVGDEKGSKAVTFAATYKLNPRYTITYGWQYDFGMGGLIYNQVSLVRRYHRLFYAFTYKADETLDSHAIILSIWPEGVSELSTGSRRYMGLDSPEGRID
ncbi:MAG: hypothetical protein WCE45_04705 [Sedimentisphaerales bacterium]